MRILIADDHAVFRRGLKEILQEKFSKLTFGEAGDAADTLQRVWKETWDILVLDLSMPGRSGLDILGEIHKARPKLPVLVLSAHPEEQFGVRVLKAGAAGYITKLKAPMELAAAVQKVLEGGRYVSPSLAEKLAEAAANPSEQALHETLSDREFQVLQLIGAGRSVKEIAGELNLSEQTVSTYRTRLLQKTRLKTTADLIRYAIENKLIE